MFDKPAEKISEMEMQITDLREGAIEGQFFRTVIADVTLSDDSTLTIEGIIDPSLPTSNIELTDVLIECNMPLNKTLTLVNRVLMSKYLIDCVSEIRVISEIDNEEIRSKLALHDIALKISRKEIMQPQLEEIELQQQNSALLGEKIKNSIESFKKQLEHSREVIKKFKEEEELNEKSKELEKDAIEQAKEEIKESTEEEKNQFERTRKLGEEVKKIEQKTLKLLEDVVRDSNFKSPKAKDEGTS